KEVLSQDSCVSPPTKPIKLVGYYPAYKPNNLKPGKDFNISTSLDYLNYVAYGPNDLVNNVNNINSGGDPVSIFGKLNHYSKLNDLIDIDYPSKFQCNPSIGTNFSDFISSIESQLLQSGISNTKILTITAGQYPPANMSFEGISFVNIQAFRLNINTGNASAGIEQIKAIQNFWNFASLEDSKLVLAVEFGETRKKAEK
ncbi:7271_t:CDS:2, partial [Dentiscutata heterogama]